MIEIANPQQPHCAIVFVIDTSESMSGEKINDLNVGLKAFKEEIEQDDLFSKRVDLAILTFNNEAQVINDFSSIENFDPPTLSAGGCTSMSSIVDAIMMAVEMIEKRKQDYKQKGIDYWRPRIFMMMDGDPTDMQSGDPIWSKVIRDVHEWRKNELFLFFGITFGLENTELLKQIIPSNKSPLNFKERRLIDYFDFFSSVCSISISDSGEQARLEYPATVEWGKMSL